MTIINSIDTFQDPFKWTEVGGVIGMAVLPELQAKHALKYFAVPGPWNYGQITILFKRPELFMPLDQVDQVSLCEGGSGISRPVNASF